MARIDWVEARLQRWAEWLKVGDGAGYPARCVLHENWSPPSPGTTPQLKVAPPSDAPQTHRIVLGLSERMRATLAAHYLLGMTAQDAAAVLECAPDTVHQRIERAHALIAQALAERQPGLPGVFATTTD